jgi:hypothetical protein
MAKDNRQNQRVASRPSADEGCGLTHADNPAEKLPELVFKYFRDEIQEALAEVAGAIQAGKHTTKRGQRRKGS